MRNASHGSRQHTAKASLAICRQMCNQPLSPLTQKPDFLFIAFTLSTWPKIDYFFRQSHPSRGVPPIDRLQGPLSRARGLHPISLSYSVCSCMSLQLNLAESIVVKCHEHRPRKRKNLDSKKSASNEDDGFLCSCHICVHTHAPLS